MNYKSRWLICTLGLSLGGAALAGVAGGSSTPIVDPVTAPVSITVPALPLNAAPVVPATEAGPVTPETPVPVQTPAPVTPAPVTPAQAAEQPTGLPAGVTYVTQAEGIREYRLDNGLRVLLFPDPSAGTFTLNTTYLVGSVHENYGETGMAHLLEHLVFKGTETGGNIMQELGQRGADFNGTTWLDRTNYFETLNNTGDNLAWAIGMEADRMVNSRISGDDLKTEMTVVRNEFEAGENDPVGLTLKETQSAAYDWHNYGNSTIGNRSDVENVPIDRLQAFYRTYYQPDNAVVTLAGNFDEAQALALIAEKFGAIPRPTRTLPALYTREPAQNGERLVNVRRVGDQQLLLAAYHVPSVRHPDYPALAVLAQILGDVPGGLLHQALVPSGQARSTLVYPMTVSQPGLLMGGAILDKSDDLERAQATLLGTLEGTGQRTFTEEEVARAKQTYAASYRQLLTQPKQVGVALSESIASGDWRLSFKLRDDIEQVTVADVQRVAATYFKPSNRTLGRFIPTATPDRVEVGVAPSPEEALKDFVGREGLSAGEQLDATPAALEGRVIREQVGDVSLVLLPKETRGDRVELALALDYGNPDTIREVGAAAQFLPNLLTRGSEGLTRQQLKDRLETINSTLTVTGDGSGLVVRLSTEREHLPEALELLRSVLREPTFPQSEFAELQNLTLTTLEAGRSEPQNVALRRLSRVFMPEGAVRGDIEYSPSLDEELEDVRAVKVEDVSRFYEEVVGAGRARLSVVGDFEPQTVREAVPTLLGDFDSPVTYERFVPTLTTPAGAQEVINVPDKANAVYFAQLNYPLRDDHPDKAALDVALKIFGGGTDTRLFNRLRQQDGLSYGAYAYANQSSRDEYGNLLTFAIYNPAVREKVSAAMGEEFRRIATGGFTEAEVNNARAALLQEARAAYASDATLAAELLTQADLGRTFAFQQEWEQRLSAVTPAAAQAAFVKYLNPDDLVEVQVGTFE
ncbi:M16 family metallopeptidase [Deinococcus radiophilus]|uniref:Insulinase family protein n=1 Tax=Deinococcus radiophilus TaxID=32062 RepID=A0A431VXE6_9DEIO|nr:pitrilysin family protein [Deinococcus radiophilus]RTR27736.1 insulinase family protein [Deinococcus radiophilus]